MQQVVRCPEEIQRSSLGDLAVNLDDLRPVRYIIENSLGLSKTSVSGKSAQFHLLEETSNMRGGGGCSG
jgi:hypothetical protein